MMLRFMFVIISSILICGSSESIDNEKLNVFETIVENLVKTVQNKLSPILLKLDSNSRISSQCSSSIRQTFENALKMKQWAIQSKLSHFNIT